MKRHVRSSDDIDIHRSIGSANSLLSHSAKSSRPGDTDRHSAARLEVLLQAGSRLQAALNKHFVRLGLTMLDASVILRCVEAPSGATHGKLASELGRDKGAITHVVDRLQRNGFVTRAPHRHDRRITFIKPTAKRNTWPLL
jgi:DNA-binding MarR family transcriptional regulator